MSAINLDDIEDLPKKKKKKKIKALSTAKPAKKAKSADSAKKVKTSTAKKDKRALPTPKKKKTEKLDTTIDLDSTLEGLGSPAISETGKEIEGQLLEAISHVPDSVKRDNDQFQEYLTMFNQCAYMARKIEERFKDRTSPRDVYPLMKLYEQQREIIADLRAIRDVTELGSVIDTEVLSPMVESIAASFIGLHQAVLAWNNANLDTNQIANAKVHFDHLLRKHAKDIQQSYQASSEKMMQIFSAE